MRRFFRRHPEYLMAAFVLVLVVGLALGRSAGLAITFFPDAPAADGAEASDERPWFDLGTEVWDGRCSSCHADLTYLPQLFAAEGGRAYLPELLLFGIRGEVVIEGAPTNLRHSAYASIDADRLAAVLNVMLVSWGNDEALPSDVAFYTADDVEAARTPERSPDEVRERRPNPWE